jgi:predicted cupin superfamily sugar epimerase
VAARLSASEIVERLQLKPLPGEGGYYRETHRSPLRFDGDAPRSLTTSILYLLTDSDRSALHRLRSDEIYHFYAGDPVELLCITAEGRLERRILGNRIEFGEHCQAVVPAGVWQGSRVLPGGAWALLGTTVAPGFEFEDCELADAEDLGRWDAEVREIAAGLLAGG